MGNGLKEIRFAVILATILLLALAAHSGARAQAPAAGPQASSPPVPTGPPPSSGGIFPLAEVHRGLHATAWTVFTGSVPESMDVEILGVLRGARGPGHDMILAQLHGAKPEYTGVVAGMSGSPVYVGGKLLGSLSYRIGQFSRDPIAGITPIEQMLEVRDLPSPGAGSVRQLAQAAAFVPATNQFQPMETPLVMSGFSSPAIDLWRSKMAGTGLDLVAAGGGASGGGASEISASGNGARSFAISKSAIASVVPGSAVSLQLVRGDLEIAATCTVTYVDPTQLLACGHPVLQAGPVSLPMTTTEVVATLASPLNAFKIVNTGEPIGAFTDDRDAAIRGVFGLEPRMIPVHVSLHGGQKSKQLSIEVIDLPSLTPQAVLVSIYQTLLETNDSSAETSYHVTGTIATENFPDSPVDLWVSAGDGLPAPMTAALLVGDRFSRIYSNEARTRPVRSVNLDIESIPHRIALTLESARIVSSNIVHAGDIVTIEATLRPWQQPARNVRIPVQLPARLQPGTLRVLVSDAGTLDRTLDQPRPTLKQPDISAALAQAASQHAQDRIYVSLLIPETQAGIEGSTLTGLPITVANAMENLKSGQDVILNGESAVLTTDIPAQGVPSGFQVLNLKIEPGSGVN